MGIRGARGKPQYFVAITQDIGERKRAEEALVASEEELRHAQKLELTGQLAGGIAHDFNNLLSVILSCADSLADDLGEGHPLLADLHDITAAGERAAALTRQLLIFSRKQVPNLRVLDLQSAVADIEKMLRRIIGEDVTLEIALGAGACHVRVDPRHLEQVIVALAANARDAMPTGGRITMTTRRVTVREAGEPGREPLPAGPYAALVV